MKKKHIIIFVLFLACLNSCTLKNIKNLKKDVEILLWLFSDNEETEEEWQNEKTTYKPNSIEMVPIPAGTFTMGGFSTESMSWDNERPQHQVTLSGFRMGRYEVTQEQYQSVMGKNPSHFYSNSRKGEIQEKRPVDSVSWYDALVFCNRLSVLDGLSPAYSIGGGTDTNAWGKVPKDDNKAWDAVEIVAGSNGYRLPTEAQWEYACRAGTTTAYYTGDDISDETGWYRLNSGYKTHQVGLKTANLWGLHDMHGNVEELCWDWYDENYYSDSPSKDPMGPSSGTSRVKRGGYIIYSVESLRSASRSYVSPYSRGNAIRYGFRLVLPGPVVL